MDRDEYQRWLDNYHQRNNDFANFNGGIGRGASGFGSRWGGYFGGGSGGGGRGRGGRPGLNNNPYDPVSNLSTLSYSTDAEDMNADLIRAEYEDYRQRYLPLERELMRLAMDPEEKKKAVNRAGEEVESGYANASAQSSRTARRYGIEDPSKRVGFARNRELDKSASIAQAKNQTRKTHDDLVMSIMSGSHNNSSNNRLSGG